MESAKNKSFKSTTSLKIFVQNLVSNNVRLSKESINNNNNNNNGHNNHSLMYTKTLPVVCHGTLFFLFAGSFIYNIFFDIKMQRSILMDYIYLTHWNLTFQIFFNGLELISDLFPKFAERTLTFRDKFFHSITFPYSMFVSMFFWSICLYDENLIREPPEERPEEWYNHVVHTLVVPATLFQGMVTYHKLSSKMECNVITLLFGFIYICWTFCNGIVFNRWAYELLHSSTLHSLIILLTVATIALVTINEIERIVHKKFWRIH